jgi:signal transduction histidine kinase
VLTVGWVLLAVFGALRDKSYPALYWTLLTVGTTFMVLLVVGVVLYLVLSVKAINLNRRQSNFIDSVTHELKSPIASMKLYLQTLNLRQVSHEQQADFYRYMLEDVHRLDHLINQMLDAGRLETGRRNGEAEDVALEGLLRDCAATVCLRYRVPSDTVRLELQPCVVRARRVDLEMIFRNLLDNAVKYAGSQPEVEVTLQPQSDGCTVTRIGDNGRGIPHKLRRKIFGRFVRLGMELQREKPGTGLGLYIVRTLVKRLGGRVRVHDREAGPGTIFEIQLPGLPAEEMEKEADNV